MARVRGKSKGSGPGIRKADVVEVRLTGYRDDGTAQGRLGDLEIRVARGARGDLVRVVVEHVSPHAPVAWGSIIEILEPGPGRVTAPCSLSDRCGGCPWMHLDYEEQLEEKRRRAEMTAEHLGFSSPVTVARSPEIFHYRNRGKYVVARTKAGLVLGAYAPRSHRVVETIGCLAVEPVVDQVARQVAPILSAARIHVYRPETGGGLLRYLAVRANHRSKALVTLVTNDEPSPGLVRAADRIADCADVSGVTVDINSSPGNVIFSGKTRVLSGRQRLVEQFGSVSVELAGHSFGQVNRAQATRMYEQVVDFAVRPLGSSPVGSVLELFSGAGAMSLMLAGAGVSVRGVELDAAAVESASRSAASAGLSDRCRFFAGDANESFEKVAAGFDPEVVVVNPPRSGLKASLVMALARAQVPRIIYVSCNPATLVRDAGFLRDVGYYVRDLQGFDMMPHTPHLELVSVLQRYPASQLNDRKRENRTG